MIFSEDHIEQIKAGTKTQTRRSSDRYQVGKLYAIQPCRTCKGIEEGKIYIGQKIREWKPDFSDLPTGVIERTTSFTRRWRAMEAGYPIRDGLAKAEGGYTSEEYEELYEKMHPGWIERWAYWFMFFTADEIEECTRISQQLRTDQK